MIVRRLSKSTLATAERKRSIPVLVAVSAVLAVALAGCGSQAPVTSAKAKIDPKLGVAPSPRVVAMGQKVPKGGGKSMVGRPYTVAGKRYVPQLDPDYSRVGLASWYGDAFHGRRTANGEIFDSTALTAAHPTMPLPSYARVTSLDTGRSIVVRVNDRGPFHSNRMIDISRRAADVIGVRRAGIGRVKVDYVGPAPVQGDDTAYLMASYRGPAEGIQPGMPETMVADAGLGLPGVGRIAGAIGSAIGFGDQPSAETPRRTAPVEQPIVVAAAETAAPAVASEAPAGPMVPGTALPPPRPLEDPFAAGYVTVATVDPADVYMTGGTQVATLAPALVPASFQVGAQPVAFQAAPATASPAFATDPAPAVDGVAPMPIPNPATLDAPRSSYAADRVDGAYAAVDGIDSGVGLSELARKLGALGEARQAPAVAPSEMLQVGLFADPANAARVGAALAGIGRVALDDVVVGGRALTRVRVSALAVTPAEAVAAAERAGASGARIVR